MFEKKQNEEVVTPKMQEKKNKKKAELDMHTTVANMNVEGFSWYDPSLKDGEKKPTPKLTKEEQRALIKGAYKAMIPMLVCIGHGCLLMFFLAYLWLK